MELKEVLIEMEYFLNQKGNILSGKDSPDYIDIVDTFRKLYQQADPADLDTYCRGEKDKDWGWAADAVCNEIDRLNCIMLEESEDNKWIPITGEQDVTFFHIDFGGLFDEERKLTTMQVVDLLLRIYYWFDCDGCCDATEWCRLNQCGVLIWIQSGRTMHS